MFVAELTPVTVRYSVSVSNGINVIEVFPTNCIKYVAIVLKKQVRQWFA